MARINIKRLIKKQMKLNVLFHSPGKRFTLPSLANDYCFIVSRSLSTLLLFPCFPFGPNTR
jgi:hypothetical protein